MLRTRSPRASLYCYKPRVRLACVKHAASVRSEPGSNSRLNLVFPTVKTRVLTIGNELFKSLGFTLSPGTIGTEGLPQGLIRSDQRVILKSPDGHPTRKFGIGRNTKTNQTGSGLFHSIVKEQVLPGQLEGLRTNPNLIDADPDCQGINSCRKCRRLWKSAGHKSLVVSRFSRPAAPTTAPDVRVDLNVCAS